MTKHKQAQIVKEIAKLADALGEKRSDIAEILYDILDGKEFDPTMVESRFISATIPASGKSTRVQYDTLRTMIEYVGLGKMHDADDHEYHD